MGLIEKVAYLLAAPQVQLFAGAGNRWSRSALIFSCQPAAVTSEIAKRFWPRVCV